MANDSRQRMVRSAVSLISTRGVSGTSFSDVLADSGAPRGSIYHHFPDGKQQLATAAISLASDWVLARQRACEATTAGEVLDSFIGLWRQVVVASGGQSGCTVAGVAIDTTVDDAALLTVVRDTFRAWVALLTEQLEAAGLPAQRARTIATTTLAAMEGALILCRAEGGSGPLDEVAAELRRLLPDPPQRRSTLPSTRPSTGRSTRASSKTGSSDS